MRRIRLFLWLLVPIATVAVGFVWNERSSVPDPEASAGVVAIGGEFSLVSHDGKRRTWADFRGKPTAVFFGFTQCPEICPTTLASLSVVLEDLGDVADQLNVLLMTVDPERDTPAVLADYMSSFDPRILGLTGTEDEVAKAAAAFKAMRRKVLQGDGDYTYDHTAAVYLFRSDGSFAGTLDRHDRPEDQRAKMRRLFDA